MVDGVGWFSSLVFNSSSSPAVERKPRNVTQFINYDFPRRAVGCLQTPDASRRARTANVQLFPALLPPSHCPAHSALGAVESAAGVRLPAGDLCLFDPFVVHGGDGCAFD